MCKGTIVVKNAPALNIPANNGIKNNQCISFIASFHLKVIALLMNVAFTLLIA